MSSFEYLAVWDPPLKKKKSTKSVKLPFTIDQITGLEEFSLESNVNCTFPFILHHFADTGLKEPRPLCYSIRSPVKLQSAKSNRKAQKFQKLEVWLIKSDSRGGGGVSNMKWMIEDLSKILLVSKIETSGQILNLQ